MAPRPGTTQNLAYYIANTYYSEQGGRSGPHQWDGHSISVNIATLNAEGQKMARAAFEAWEAVADLHFVEVSGGADISFTDDHSGATTSKKYGLRGGMIDATVKIGTDRVDAYGSHVGSFTFRNYVHEIGHALGLGHTGHYDYGQDFKTAANFTNDSWQTSIMSYFYPSSNPYITGSDAMTVTPMLADIMAIQWMYEKPGLNSSTASNTTWGLGADTGTYLDAFLNDPAASLRIGMMSIYDRSGTDLIDFSDDTLGQKIDLRQDKMSSVYGLINNVSIATGSVIENYRAGSGADSVRGNDAANRIQGNAGDDHLSGERSRDVLLGGEGNDRLFGGEGGDELDGGLGNDLLSGGAGTDRLSGGAGDDVLYGIAGDDVLKGDEGQDTLLGGFGDNELRGGEGNDLLTGGFGEDVFVFNTGADIVTDFQDGRDTLMLDRALWGGAKITVAQVLSYAHLDGDDVVFDFGTGNTLRLEDLGSIRALSDDLAFA